MAYDVLVNGCVYDSFEAESHDDFYWEDFVDEHEDELREFDDPNSVFMMLVDEGGNSNYHVCLGDYIKVDDDDDDDDDWW